MKSKFMNFRLPGILIFSAMMITGFLFSGCEPETIDNQFSEVTSDFRVNADQKADHKNLPHQEIARLRAAVAAYHNVEKAKEDGYIVEETDYFPHMGYHFLNPEYIGDKEFDLEHPEFLIYVDGPNGELRFVGVEYAVIIEDLSNPPPAPEGFTGDADEWHINEVYSLWTLHAWVGLQNPDGIFADLNMRLP